MESITLAIYFKRSLLAFAVLLTLPLCAQPTGDPAWNANPYFFDDFTTSGRFWDGNWFDRPQDKWRGHMVGTGCYHGWDYEWQVFQPQMLQFKPTEGVLRIESSIEGGPMNCGDYLVPPGYTCDPTFPKLYCYSGAMEVLNPGEFLYGYFEIRCKLPVHRGAFPAFWLYKESDNEYREIDIFEYSHGFGGDGRTTTRQIYYKKADEDKTTTYGHMFDKVPEGEADLTAWHTFALDWSPGRVVFYADGRVTNSYAGEGVPDKPMGLIVNYSIDNYIGYQLNPPTGPWVFNPPADFPSEMVVDYVLVQKMRADCSSEVRLINQNELVNFDGGYKKSIVLDPIGSSISFLNYPSKVMRAGSIVLTKDIDVPVGTEMEFVTHGCPQ